MGRGMWVARLEACASLYPFRLYTEFGGGEGSNGKDSSALSTNYTAFREKEMEGDAGMVIEGPHDALHSIPTRGEHENVWRSLNTIPYFRNEISPDSFWLYRLCILSQMSESGNECLGARHFKAYTPNCFFSF